MVMVRQRIRADSALFDVKEIAYDHWNATHIALRLQNEKLAHGGNPVTRWTAANVAVAQAPPATSSLPRTRAPSASSPSSRPSAAPSSLRRSSAHPTSSGFEGRRAWRRSRHGALRHRTSRAPTSSRRTPQFRPLGYAACSAGRGQATRPGCVRGSLMRSCRDDQWCRDRA